MYIYIYIHTYTSVCPPQYCGGVSLNSWYAGAVMYVKSTIFVNKFVTISNMIVRPRG